MNGFVINSFEFCRLGERREGSLELADLPRLAKEVASSAGPLQWIVQGGTDQFGYPRLELTVNGSVDLLCQRCLTPFSFIIASSSTLILAKDEQELDSIDAVLEDDELDVILGSKEFNLVEVIEDEALLALPLAPKHATCPDAATIEALKAAVKPSPFAILKNLK
jgi:uncharacterized protein